VMAILHGHHTHEDEDIWPLLLDRCGESVAPLVGLMEDQHQQVATLLLEIDEALSVWREGATGDSRGVLVEALDRLTPALKEHLSTEEDRVVPLMEQHITVAEWHTRMGTELAADPEHLPLTFGMLMYEGDPESIGQFIAAMPADAGLIIRRLARPAFTTHSQRVHGTPTPPRSTEL